MTAPDPRDQAQDAEPATTAVEEPTPAPEPWTPERVREWNRYYDIYVAAGALLLILLASIHPVSEPSFWSDIQTGRLIAASGPVTEDPFSYTMYGSRWVDIPWLFQLAQAKVFELAARFSGTNPEQAGTTATILLNALVRMLAALVLLQVRRPGPGAWWLAVCLVLGFGGMLMPYPGGTDSLILPVLGGIAGPAFLDSSSWGVLLLCIELLLLDRAARGSRGALMGLVPLFLAWANIDDTFLVGLLLFALRAIAAPYDCQGEDSGGRVAPGWWFGMLGAAVVATLANPWFEQVYPTAAAPLLNLIRPASEVLTYNQLGFFGPKSWENFDVEMGAEGAYRIFVAYYLVLVGIGVASFLLNRRRFSLGRFLTFALAAVLWGVVRAYGPIFTAVFVATIGINGQEWYQDRFGVAGRLGRGWTAWSVGGRAVTLVVVFAFIFKGLTGAWASRGEPVFGVGMNADEFAFEAAEYLGKAPLEGNVLNLRLAHGDALIWKAWPINRLRRTYIDGRPHLFPPWLQDQLSDLQRAFAEGRPRDWKPLLDDHGISVVMVPMRGDPMGTRPTYSGMARSADWIPFYDDGSVVLFGRADAPENDLAYFREHRLDAERLAFHSEREVPSSDRVPTPSSWIDGIFQNQARRFPQPHVWSARRWLTVRKDDPTQPPDLAHCLLAVGQARAALAQDPDDPAAWDILGEAYRLLYARESAILQAANQPTAPAEYINLRLQQRLTVLNFAIQSSPPPTTEDERVALAALHQELGELHLSLSQLDLARDQFVKVREYLGAAGFPEALELTLAQLDEQIAAVEAQLSDLTMQQQAGPIQLAEVAISGGAPGIAIRQLADVESAGINPDAVKAQLVDIYCQVGMPDRALELISAGTIEDPALSTGPGTASHRQALVYYLIGSYDLATTLWRDRSLPQLRGAMVFGSLEATRNLLRGLPREASNAFLEVPEQLNAEAVWEYQLGLCMLEAGDPTGAAERFQAALKLKSDLAVAPLLRAYLEKLGVPAPDAEVASPTGEPAASTSQPASEPTPETGPSATMPRGLDAFAGDAEPTTAAPAEGP